MSSTSDDEAAGEICVAGLAPQGQEICHLENDSKISKTFTSWRPAIVPGPTYRSTSRSHPKGGALALPGRLAVCDNGRASAPI